MLNLPPQPFDYLDHDQLVDLLSKKRCPPKIIEKVQNAGCGEFELRNNDPETLMQELNLTKLQLSALLKILSDNRSSQQQPVLAVAQQHQLQINTNSTPKHSLITFEDRYEKISNLGSGAFATVEQVTLKHNPTIVRAVKIIHNRQDFGVNEALKEVIQTTKVDHEHVVKIHGAFITANNTLMIEMDCMEFGSLQHFFIDKKRKPSGKIVILIILQILSALKYMMHKYKMVHRDIKPANVLIRSIDLVNDSIDICLGDFGFARSFAETSLASICGTLVYMAPEIIQYANDGNIEQQPYSTASDIFALGATMCYLMTLSEQKESNRGLLLQSVLSSQQQQYRPDLVGVILRMLSKNPLDRDLEKITTQLMKISAEMDQKNNEPVQVVHVVDRRLSTKSHPQAEEEDDDVSFESCERDANQDSSDAQYAQFKLAYMYEHGKGCEQSNEKAFEWYQSAAFWGNAKAQTKLGLEYLNGGMCEQSFPKAFELFQDAATQENAEAQYNLGCMYYYGNGCEKSYERAIELFQLSAYQGHDDAQFKLGCMIDKGEGCEPSKDSALYWHQQSAHNGNENASFVLALYTGKQSGTGKYTTTQYDTYLA